MAQQKKVEIEVQSTADGSAYSAWFKAEPHLRAEGVLTRSTAVGVLICIHGAAMGIEVSILPRAVETRPAPAGEQVATGATTFPGSLPAVKLR